MLFSKKHEKQFIMNTENKTKTNGEKSQKIHFYEQHESCYPFSILETNEVINDEGQVEQFFEPVLGNYKITDKKWTTLKGVEDYIKSKPYDLILALIFNTLELKEKYEKEKQ